MSHSLRVQDPYPLTSHPYSVTFRPDVAITALIDRHARKSQQTKIAASSKPSSSSTPSTSHPAFLCTSIPEPQRNTSLTASSASPDTDLVVVTKQSNGLYLYNVSPDLNLLCVSQSVDFDPNTGHHLITRQS
jgi:hypothetical protein